jgi:hypothetical protein
MLRFWGRSRARGRLAGPAKQHGFSLAEVLVGGLVLVVGLVAISQFFASAVARVSDSDLRSVLHQVANEELEAIRALPYKDVGTIGGHPEGVLLADEDRTVSDQPIHVHRDVVFWTDATYEGPYPANYRRVTVTVSLVGDTSAAPVELTSNVAGGAEGGSLDITVTDTHGSSVPNARITITNSNLVPNVNINSSALLTNSEGRLLVPGLKPDASGGYFVSASKSGYNTDRTDVGVVVNDGRPYSVVHLIIDELSNMVIHVVGSDGIELAGLNLSVVGPDEFSRSITSAAGGVTLNDIRYSTDLDPYVVSLLEGQGYDAQQVQVVVDPGTTRQVTITLDTVSPATTSTTVTVPATLRVRTIELMGTSGNKSVPGATVIVGGVGTYATTEGGWTPVIDLTTGTYMIQVICDGFLDYTGTVTVTGATKTDVLLTRTDGGHHP